MLKDIDNRITQILEDIGLKLGFKDIIGGGFIRDVLLQRTWKDVDITCHMPDLINIKRFGGKRINIPTRRMLNGGEVTSVSILLPSGISLDLKLTDDQVTTKQVALENQCNICQCAWSKQEGLWISPAFLQGVQEKRIFVTPGIDNWHKGTDREWDHLAKMKVYFPDWECDAPVKKKTTPRYSEGLNS